MTRPAISSLLAIFLFPAGIKCAASGYYLIEGQADQDLHPRVHRHGGYDVGDDCPADRVALRRWLSRVNDQCLLERFTASRDAAGEVAFAAPVTTYGPIVLRVCRQLLGDRHHAEDAFQAVFLVLARKAGSIRNVDLLGPWLYGVAIARRGRPRSVSTAGAGSRRASPGTSGMGSAWLAEPTVEPAAEPAIAREHIEAIHDEIDRLPRDFRLAVVLCYFEELTLDEARATAPITCGDGPKPVGPIA